MNRHQPILSELLAAAVAAARADAGVLAALGGSPRVWNHAPQDTPLPYALIKLGTVTDDSTKDARGYQLTLAAECWTQQLGDVTAIGLARALISLFDDRPGSLDVLPPVLLCQFDGQDHSVDPSGSAHLCSLRFRILWTSA